MQLRSTSELFDVESKVIGKSVRSSDSHKGGMKLGNDSKEELIQREDIVTKCIYDLVRSVYFEKFLHVREVCPRTTSC